MSSTMELDAIGRILLAIDRYHHRRDIPQELLPDKQLQAHLKQHLSARDWLFWHRLQVRKAVRYREALVDAGRAVQAFKLLLSQYKRAGYEGIEVWKQA